MYKEKSRLNPCNNIVEAETVLLDPFWADPFWLLANMCLVIRPVFYLSQCLASLVRPMWITGSNESIWVKIIKILKINITIFKYFIK